MTEFPELQQALVAAAGRRRRAPRLARPLIVAIACAAIAVAVVAIARQPNDERSAAPAADPLESYAVFQRPATRGDAVPGAVSSMPSLRIDEARLVKRSGPWRIYLVAGTLDQREVLCAFAVMHEHARYGCDPAGTVHGYGFPPGDGEPGVLVATVPDGIDEVEIDFPSGTAVDAVEENAAFVQLDHWPAGRGTIKWDGGEVALKSP